MKDWFLKKSFVYTYFLLEGLIPLLHVYPCFNSFINIIIISHYTFANSNI